MDPGKYSEKETLERVVLTHIHQTQSNFLYENISVKLLSLQN